MKIQIVIEALPENKFEVTIEDDVAITKVVTTAPQKYILKTLGDMGVKGKRGARKGRTLKDRAVDPALLVSSDSSIN